VLHRASVGGRMEGGRDGGVGCGGAKGKGLGGGGNLEGDQVADDIPDEGQQAVAQLTLQAAAAGHHDGAHVAGVHVPHHVWVVLLPHLDLCRHQVGHHLLHVPAILGCVGGMGWGRVMK